MALFPLNLSKLQLEGPSFAPIGSKISYFNSNYCLKSSVYLEASEGI